MSNAGDARFETTSIVSNMAWKLFERGSSVVVTLIVNIVLAWLLGPEVHGLLALVTVFVTISEIFVSAGMSSSLTQKKDADELDFSTMFWINLTVSCFIYLMLFVFAPWIAKTLGYNELTAILRVLGIRVLVAAINSIQCAYIARNMLFKHYFYSTLTGKIVSGVIGVIMAMFGAGVWALVTQMVLLLSVETVVLWFRVKWRPQFRFSWNRGKSLYAFAWRVMLTSFVENITDQLRNLIIGKEYTASELGYYNKGFLFPSALTTNVTSAISGVMFPVLSNAQDDLKKLKELCRNWIGTFGLVVFPMLMGMATLADVLVPLVLSEKWLPSILFLQIACGIYVSWIVEVPIREAIRSIGRADVCLGIQIIKAVISVIVLVVTLKYGVVAIAYGALLCAFINVLVSAFYGKKYIRYLFRELLMDVGPSIMMSVVMAWVISLIKKSMEISLFGLLLQILVGVVVYVMLAMLTRNTYFLNMMSSIKNFKKGQSEHEME